MKLISLFVTLCFAMNVFASTNSIKAFEDALDEYHYSISVEWDQKDVKFQEKKAQEFFNKVKPLIVEGDLNQQDIISVIEKRVSNKTVMEAMKLKLSLAGDYSSPEELAKFMHESSKEFYSKGASWNGTIMIPVTIIFVAMTALGFAMWYSATHGCQEYEQICDPQFGCRNNYNVCLKFGYVGPHL